MSANRRDRRKNKNRKKSKSKKDTVSKKDKIYGILALIILFFGGFVAPLRIFGQTKNILWSR